MMNFCPGCGYNLSSHGMKAPQNTPSEVKEATKESIIDDYTEKTTDEGVEIAQPTYLDNRKRLQMLASRPTPIIKPVRMDKEMDEFAYGGQRLSVGEGLVQTF